MNKNFCYSTHQKAFTALSNSRNVDFDEKSHEQIDYWIKEFIRDSPDDIEWLFSAIDIIGRDNLGLKVWFNKHVKQPDLWSKKSYSLIAVLAYSLTSN